MSAEPMESSVNLADALDVAAGAWLQFRGGTSLGAAIDQAVADVGGTEAAHPRLRAAVMDITTTAVRQLALIETAIDLLTKRPPDPEVDALLAVALGQWFAQRYVAHTLVDQTVRAAKSHASTLGAAGFINAVLRNAIRRGVRWAAELRAKNECVRLNAPKWWIDALRRAWPHEWESVLALSAQPAPLVLRVNTRQTNCAHMLHTLSEHGIEATRVGETAIRLAQACPVARIPGFEQGWVSVQDAGAQLAAHWLDAQPGQRVLDACAAPGGKTAHILERCDVQVDALELDAARAQRIEHNLKRLALTERARVIVADAARPEAWSEGQRYERILLDAPCTASGIVRRHPDIPWLRRPQDVALLARTQARLLDALWPLLAPAGRLLYVVCSVFPQEGGQNIESFLARHAGAALVPLPGQSAGQSALTLLPRDDVTTGDASDTRAQFDAPSTHDGFCYALIEKLS